MAVRHSGSMRLGKRTEVQPGPPTSDLGTHGALPETQPARGKGRAHLKEEKKEKTTSNKKPLYLHKLQKKKKNLGHRKELLLKRAHPPWAPSLSSPLSPSPGAAGVCGVPRHKAGMWGGAPVPLPPWDGSMESSSGTGQWLGLCKPRSKNEEEKGRCHRCRCVGVRLCWEGWCDAWFIQGGCGIGEKAVWVRAACCQWGSACGEGCGGAWLRASKA